MILLAIGEAVAAAHKQRVIHRDLKPSNILRDPTSGQVFLIDFDTAKDLGNLTMTRSGESKPPPAPALRPRRHHGAPRRPRPCLETHAHIAIIGPVGVGKTFLAHALRAAACRRGHNVLAHRCDRMFKALRHARLDATYEAELRKLLAADLLILDDFGLDAMDAAEGLRTPVVGVAGLVAGRRAVASARAPGADK